MFTSPPLQVVLLSRYNLRHKEARKLNPDKKQCRKFMEWLSTGFKNMVCTTSDKQIQGLFNDFLRTKIYLINQDNISLTPFDHPIG